MCREDDKYYIEYCFVRNGDNPQPVKDCSYDNDEATSTTPSTTTPENEYVEDPHASTRARKAGGQRMKVASNGARKTAGSGNGKGAAGPGYRRF
jgi:hypothetical protein